VPPIDAVPLYFVVYLTGCLVIIYIVHEDVNDEYTGVHKKFGQIQE
jgi:hypothetical protein